MVSSTLSSQKQLDKQALSPQFPGTWWPGFPSCKVAYQQSGQHERMTPGEQPPKLLVASKVKGVGKGMWEWKANGDQELNTVPPLWSGICIAF